MEETQYRILQKAAEMFTMKGIRAVSMDDICSELGISKKTIYKYFTDKKAIVHEVTKSLIGVAQNTCSEKCQNAENAVQELINLISFINQFFNNMNPVVMYDLEKLYPQSYAIFQNHQDGFLLNQIKTNLQRGIAEGFYRKELDIEIVSKLRIGQINLAFDHKLFPPSIYEVRKTQLISLDLYMMGITTEKGRQKIKEYKTL